MPRVRRLLVPLLALLGLLSAPAWEGTALGCPANSVAAAPMVRTLGCRHAPMPAQPQPASHERLICSSLCFAVLSTPAAMGPRAPIAFAPLTTRLQPLSGIDPGLEPPPPRLG